MGFKGAGGDIRELFGDWSKILRLGPRVGGGGGGVLMHLDGGGLKFF